MLFDDDAVHRFFTWSNGNYVPLGKAQDIQFTTHTTPLKPNIWIDWGDAEIVPSPFSPLIEFPSLTTKLDSITEQLRKASFPIIYLHDGHRSFQPDLFGYWDDPNNALGGLVIAPTVQCMITCSSVMKEKIMQLAESQWNKCPFTDGCQPQDDYDCRKCLERRIKWEIQDELF